MAPAPSSEVHENDSHFGDAAENYDEANTRRGTLASTASFRSATSFKSGASFRSCHSYKSMGTSSFRSVISRGASSYHSVRDRNGQINLGYQDTDLSFQSTVTDPDTTNIPQDNSTQVVKNSSMTRISDRHPIYLGYLLQYVACVLLSVSSICLQLLLVDITISSLFWLIILSHSILLLVLTIPLLLLYRLNPFGPPGYRWKLYLTTLITSGLTLSLHLSSPHITSFIMFTFPITIILSVILTKEPLGIYRLLTISLLLVGTTILTRPQFLSLGPTSSNNNFNILQLNMASLPVVPPNTNTTTNIDNTTTTTNLYYNTTTTSLVASMFVPLLSSSLLVLQHQCRAGGTKTPVVLVWSILGSGVTSIIGLAINKSDISDITQMSVNQWTLVCLMVCLSCLALSLSTISVVWIPPGKVVLIRSTQIVVTFLLQLVAVTSSTHVWLDMGGVVCVTIVVFVVMVEDLVVDKKRWKWF